MGHIDAFFVAAKGFIIHEGKVLILREAKTNPDGSHAGYFDIPGGRMHPGEHLEDTLIREIFEETGLNISIGQPFAHGEWRPIVRGEQWQIIALFFTCTTQSTQITLSNEHDTYEWIDPTAHTDYMLNPNLHQIFNTFITQ